MPNFKVLFIYPNLMLQTGFPFAICILSSVLKKVGIDVNLFDSTFYKTQKVTSDEARMENLQVKPFDLGEKFRNLEGKKRMFEDLVDKIEQYEPNLIAISILEDVFPLAVEMLNSIKHFEIPKIAGGVFPTFSPDAIFDKTNVDMVCIGEGEEAIKEVCLKLANKEDISRVENLWVKRNGKIIKNKLRHLINLDDNPLPDFSIFNEDRFLKPMKGKLLKMGPVETDRGCPFNCAFCNSRSQKSLYKSETGESFFRVKDIGKIYDDLRYLVDKYDVEYIYFPSDTFLSIGKNVLREFSTMYKKIGLPFYCQTRPETISEETVDLLERMGCHSLSIGIEHGNEEFRKKVLLRKVSNNTYINAIKLLENSKIMVAVNNMIGFPDETRELAFDTINLNRKLNVYAHNAYYFTPYHGSALRKYCENRGYISKDSQTVNITKGTILNMPQFSADEINGLIRTFTLYVKFPESRFDEIRQAEKFTDGGNAVFKKLQQEFWKKFFR